MGWRDAYPELLPKVQGGAGGGHGHDLGPDPIHGALVDRLQKVEGLLESIPVAEGWVSDD